MDGSLLLARSLAVLLPLLLAQPTAALLLMPAAGCEASTITAASWHGSSYGHGLMVQDRAASFPPLMRHQVLDHALGLEPGWKFCSVSEVSAPDSGNRSLLTGIVAGYLVSHLSVACCCTK